MTNGHKVRKIATLIVNNKGYYLQQNSVIDHKHKKKHKYNQKMTY